MAAENLCLYNKFGFCKFRDTCKFRHVQEKCENSDCEVNNCQRRHPKECRYWRDFNRCKFGDYCLYKHETSRPRQPFENEFEIVKQELERLLKLLAEKDEKICVIMKNFENVEKAENEAKIKYDNVIRDLDEKAVKIEELESKLEKFTETAKKPEENLQRTLHETFAPYLEHFDIIENRANYRLDTLEKQLLSLTATSNHKKRGRNSDAT